MGMFGWVFEKWLPIGVDIVFLGQPRESGLLTNFDINEEKKVAVDIRYVGHKKNKMTGYWFNVDDFSPALDSIDIRAYGGLIVCWKNRDGKNTFLPPELKHYQETIAKLKKSIEIYKRQNMELLNTIEGRKLGEERKKDNIEGIKQLKMLKDVVSDGTIPESKRESSSSIKSLFSR